MLFLVSIVSFSFLTFIFGSRKIGFTFNIKVSCFFCVRGLLLYRFLKKLLTEDLPRLFVRPKKIVLDFQKGMAVGPVPNDSKSGDIQEGNNDFVGELSVTLLDARKLSYIFYGTDIS